MLCGKSIAEFAIQMDVFCGKNSKNKPTKTALAARHPNFFEFFVEKRYQVKKLNLQYLISSRFHKNITDLVTLLLGSYTPVSVTPPNLNLVDTFTPPNINLNQTQL